MFRDLKEYQEIAKIYAEKVSKPEDLDERVRGGGVSSNPVKPFEKPSGSAAGSGNVRGQFAKPGIPLNKPMNSGAQGKTKPQPKPKPETDSTGKVIPSTAEIRAAAAAKRGGTPAIGGGNAGASTDSGGTSKSTIKSVPVEKDKPEVSTMTKQGKPRTKAQMMAAKRIASGKSIDDVKAANTASMKAKASERNQKFQDAKKSGNLAQFRKDNPKMSGADRAKAMAKARLAKKAAMENYTPYDIVLEYLLSSEQVATIEEANYVMTEMDAETIQGIVEMDMMKMPVVNVLGGLAAAGGAVKGIASYLGRKAGERGIKKEGEKPGKPGLVKTIKDRTDATNKAIEKMNNP